MLVTLVHSTLLTENHSERDENKKLYLNLMKKLKKEIGEKNNASIKVIRQLLPLYKQTTEVCQYSYLITYCLFMRMVFLLTKIKIKSVISQSKPEFFKMHGHFCIASQPRFAASKNCAINYRVYILGL